MHFPSICPLFWSKIAQIQFNRGKNWKNDDFGVQKGVKKWSKKWHKIDAKKGSKIDQKMTQNWYKKGVKIDAKKGTKIDQKNDLKIDKIDIITINN